MPEGAFKPRPRAVPEPQAPRPAGEQPVANDDKAWTETEEQFFAQGEARTRSAEADMARRAEAAKYDAAQAKLKKHAEGKQ